MVNAVVWNEFRHEKQKDHVAAKIYPEGIHATIASYLNGVDGIHAETATLDEPEHGLSEARLAKTDVLLWWGHMAHAEASDEVVARVRTRVLSGMGLIVLHSGHFSKIFRSLMGTNCSLGWRNDGEKERLWNVAPDHPITAGLGEYIEIPRAEMYSERFDIPEPERLIFVSWFEGGEVFRSGCTWTRGNGKVFYFRPGDESWPVYHQKEVMSVIANAVKWAAPSITADTSRCENRKTPIEVIAPKT